MIEVAGNIARRAVDVERAFMGKHIPFANALAVEVPRALALIGRVSGSPDKRSVGERSGRFAHGVPPVLGVVF